MRGAVPQGAFVNGGDFHIDVGPRPLTTWVRRMSGRAMRNRAGARDPIPNEDACELSESGSAELPSTIRFFGYNTLVDISAWGEPGACTAALKRAYGLCRDYERLFSRTLPHSDISRINDAQGNAVRIDALTYDLLRHAQRYCEASGGVFDITAGAASRLWDFRNRVVPPERVLRSAAEHIDWRALELTREAESGGQPVHYARLLDDAACIDVGGIAKGWIADEVLRALRLAGVRAALVNLGGNVACEGRKPDGSPWRIGIRSPWNARQLVGAVPVAEGAVVTSGTHERCFTGDDGRLYHHILNPGTGMPVETDVASATVVCGSALDAEGFSTTLVALGAEGARAFAVARPEILKAVLVDERGDVTTIC